MQMIDVNDHRLTAPERQMLRTIALRLEGGLVQPPHEYRAKAEAHFAASAEEGDIEERGNG